MYQTVFLRISYYLIFLFIIACSNKQPNNRLPYYNTPDFSPVFIQNRNEINQKITHQIRDFSFIDQLGQTITQQQIEGKIHVANFIFTSCGSICPIMTKNMKAVQTSFKDDPQLVILSFSVTPWIDSVARLKKYAINNQIVSPNWHLLTGSKAEIYSLARQSYFAEEDLGFSKDSSNFLHTEHVLLIDPQKRIRGIYNGTLQLEIEQLIKDIQLLKQEELLNQ